MTSEERVAALHVKMDLLRRAQNQRKTYAIGAASTAFAVFLLILIFNGNTAHFGGTAGLHSGATMLFENASAYVLLAVIAFMTGVIITVAIQKHRHGKQDRRTPRQSATEQKERNNG